MPTLTRYTSKQAMDAATIRSGKNKGLLDIPFYTWRCSCGKRVESQVRWYDMVCGKCKKGMECTQTKGVVTEKQMYRKVAR
jgi:hypothetical protein